MLLWHKIISFTTVGLSIAGAYISDENVQIRIKDTSATASQDTIYNFSQTGQHEHIQDTSHNSIKDPKLIPESSLISLECSNRSESEEQYCIYSSSKFADGRGISIVTTPESAEIIKTLPAFTNSQIHRNLGVNKVFDPPFEAKELENRGIGLVANRTIKRGECLMSYTPTFVKLTDVTSDLKYRDLIHLQHLAFQHLPDSTRKIAEALYGQSEGRVDFINDILETNTFALSLNLETDEVDSEEESEEDSETPFTFLFPEIARLNHDCRPNVDYFFDASTLTLSMIAFREIFAGEELTITYIDPLQRRMARQKALKRNWGFKCNCALCTAPPEDVQTSDDRISTIIELREELADHSSGSEADPSMALRHISLLKKERLWTLMHDGYCAVATEYSGAGDVQNAKVYAKLALESGLVCRDEDNAEDSYRDMQAILDDGEDHPSWLFRINAGD